MWGSPPLHLRAGGWLYKKSTSGLGGGFVTTPQFDAQERMVYHMHVAGMASGPVHPDPPNPVSQNDNETKESGLTVFTHPKLSRPSQSVSCPNRRAAWLQIHRLIRKSVGMNRLARCEGAPVP